MQQFLKVLVSVVILTQTISSYPYNQTSPNTYPKSERSWYDNLSDIKDVVFSENLYPVASLVCSAIDYSRLIVPGAIPQPMVGFRDVICKNVPKEYLVDYTDLERCFTTTECMQTQQTLFGFGINEDQEVYEFFNHTTIPKRTKVKACLDSNDCDFEETARAEVMGWYDIIERCDQIDEEDQDAIMEAIMARGMIDDFDDEDFGFAPEDYDFALLTCMRRTSNPEVRRAIANSLQSSAICTEDMMMEMGRFMSEMGDEEPDSSLITLMLAQKLFSCEPINATMKTYIEPMMQSDRRSLLLRELMSMMQEQRDSLKRRARDAPGADFSNYLDDVYDVDDMDSQDIVKRWSFTEYDPLTMSDLIYNIVFISGPEFRSPYTFQMNYFKSNNPPEEHQITITLDSPVWLEPLRSYVIGEDWTQLITWFIEQFKDGEPKIPSFGITGSIYVDQFDMTSPILLAWRQDMQGVGARLMELVDFTQPMKMVLQTTDEVMKVNSSMLNGGYEMKMSIKSDDIDMYSAVSIKPIEGDGTFQSMGLEVDGYYEYQPYAVYRIKGLFYPMWFEDDAATNKRCELVFKIKNELTDESLVDFESCHRALELEQGEAVALSMYRVFEVKDVLRFNYTVDLGQNGMPQFISSPKLVEINLELFNEPVFNMTFVTRARSNMDYQGKEVPIFVIQSNSTVMSPYLGIKTQFGMTTNIFNDQSSSTKYNVYNFDYFDRQLIQQSVGGIEIKSCSAETEDFFFNLMMKGEMNMPDILCYTLEITDPGAEFKLTSKLVYDRTDDTYDETYSLKTFFLGTPIEVTGESSQSEDFYESKHKFTLPMPVTVQYTSKMFEDGIEQLLDEGVINVFVNHQGFVYSCPPQYGMGQSTTAFIGYRFSDRIHRKFETDEIDNFAGIKQYIEVNYFNPGDFSINVSRAFNYDGVAFEYIATLVGDDMKYDAKVLFPKYEDDEVKVIAYKMEYDTNEETLEAALTESDQVVARMRANCKEDSYTFSCTTDDTNDNVCKAIEIGVCPLSKKKKNCPPPLFDEDCVETCARRIAFYEPM